MKTARSASTGHASAHPARTVRPDGAVPCARAGASAVKPWLLALALASTSPGLAVGAETKSAWADLADLPLEDLMRLEVTSVSKKSEKLSLSPAAIAVITQEDIQRSGATSIPEALRLAPGLQVARVDAHQWAISSRGFNDVFANKLLVLQDGRSVYTPLFSGVFWDVQDTFLEDIDRIEVIRGPGATLWGANAVNGVINIITKTARETQGWVVTGGGGTEERGFGGIRYGGKVSDSVHYRVYGKFFDQDDSVLPGSNSDATDGWQMGRGGFRVDWEPSLNNLFTLQGDFYSGSINQTFGTFAPDNPPTYSRSVTDDYTVRGGNLLGRATHTFSDDSELSFHVYYDRTERDTVIFDETRDTFDADLTHRFQVGDRNEVVWGLGYRVSADDVGNSPTISLTPDSRTTHLYSAFVQDEITLVPDRLRLTVGTKLEHNDFTGIEVQPSGRLLWTPADRHSVWASVSRAVRTPSRAEDDVKLNQAIAAGALFPGSPTAASSAYGSRRFESEDLVAYELGYRFQPLDQLSFDLAAFYNVYNNLRTAESGPSPTQPVTAPPPPPGIVVPVHLENNMSGETYGFEAAATWQVTDWWRMHPAYTYVQMQLHTSSTSTDSSAERDEGRTPHHQLSLRSSMDFPGRVSLDAIVRYVEQLPAINVPGYVSLDLRLGWRPTDNLELSIVGQNLLDSQHPEFKPSTINSQSTEIERSVYAKITMRF